MNLFMALEEPILPVLAGLAVGFILGYCWFRIRITSLEERMRTELEAWKLECAGEIRKDSVNRSRSTLKGKIAEQMAPVLPGFGFSPADARFIGSPVDYIIFDGLTGVADDKGDEITIVFMDVKNGNGSLTRTQRLIRDAVERKSVSWKTLRIPGE